MGIGNLTELTAADSTGVNALLVAICQELGIRAAPAHRHPLRRSCEVRLKPDTTCR